MILYNKLNKSYLSMDSFLDEICDEGSMKGEKNCKTFPNLNALS